MYWRETTDPKRRHNGRPDRCYDYCLREAGKLKWVAVGWVSEGFSEQKAANMRREALEKLARGDEVVREQAARLTLNMAADAYFDWMKGEQKHAVPEQCRYDVHVRNSLGHLTIWQGKKKNPGFEAGVEVVRRGLLCAHPASGSWRSRL
ncbi:hypothetical protein [Desulfovibrio sp. ZJ200]|uniref:hypothetical protein n=1 Tax=Desulfovibrio sp. ZJ200 TaxID=2709792 RepID=UPI0013EDF9E6|nr:hypothetical protein [Desulfovibrio sp. ZJ200]